MGHQQKEESQLKSKITSSILFLTIRNIALQAISVIGFFLLSVLLSVKEIGLFGIVSEVVGILGYFSDIGLAAALIQQKEKVTDKALKTVFTIQQILASTGIIVAILIFHYKIGLIPQNSSQIFLFFSLIFSFACASLKTIPSVLLEREVDFKKLGTIDIIENIIFYTIAVGFAALNFGSNSYAIAIIIRSIVGVVIIYRYKSWNIGLGIDKDTLKSLFKFGIPFQLNSFIAIAKDRLSNLFLSGTLDLQSFGYLSWATKINRTVISIMDAFMRVMFPSLSRAQDNPELVKKIVSKAIFGISAISLPLLVLVNILVPWLVEYFPQYQKWRDALWILPWLSISMAIASITTPLTNVFSAIGMIKQNTKYMIMWLVLTWLTYPILTSKLGLQGSVLAIFIVGLSSVFVWIDIYRILKINVLKYLQWTTLASLVSPIVAIFLSQSRLVQSIIFIAFYLVALSYLEKDNVRWTLNQLRRKNENN